MQPSTDTQFPSLSLKYPVWHLQPGLHVGPWQIPGESSLHVGLHETQSVGSSFLPHSIEFSVIGAGVEVRNVTASVVEASTPFGTDARQSRNIVTVVRVINFIFFTIMLHQLSSTQSPIMRCNFLAGSFLYREYFIYTDV